MRRTLTEKASKGLEKLNSMLPLKSRQASLDEKVEHCTAHSLRHLWKRAAP